MSDYEIKCLHVKASTDIPKFGIKAGELITSWDVLYDICLAAMKERNNDDIDISGKTPELGGIARYWRKRWNLSTPKKLPSPSCTCRS